MGDISVIKSQSDYFIVSELGTLIINRVFIKEMGEPLVYDGSQFWLFAYINQELSGFMVYDLSSILYAYTKPKFRNKGVFNSLYSEVPDFVTKVVASNMSLAIFIKKGFTIIKSYKTCHRLKK